tara:strand:- start:25 stop:813 length:789 start_codon:yes stop_codon:yes gene_type:complete
MAVNINTVYQTVLYIINKEQRGYITPAEFNSLADQVQDEIFQSYFPDGNQLNRQNQNNTQNDTEFFNVFKNIDYRLYPFENEVSFVYDTTNFVWQYTNPNNVASSGQIYLIGNIISTYNSNSVSTKPNSVSNSFQSSITQLASRSDYNKIIRSKLTAPTRQYPLSYKTNYLNTIALEVFPQPDTLSVNCIFKPSKPSWGFQPGNLGQYIYSPSASLNFQLDISEQNNLVINILKYCGIIINDPTIIQAAAQEAQQASINEKS